MTQDQINRIKEIQSRHEQATEGPWTNLNDLIVQSEKGMIADDNESICRIRGHGAGLNQHANMEFIAHAREDIPFLLSLLMKNI